LRMIAAIATAGSDAAAVDAAAGPGHNFGEQLRSRAR
jgi:hypothetical protein